MADRTYNQLMNDAFRSYQAGRYAEAYELVTDISPMSNGNQSQIYNFRFCLACIAGRYDLALRIMREAIVEKGFWYSEVYLEDSDLDAIRGTTEFQELAAISTEREEAAKRSSSPQSRIFDPIAPGADCTLIALHGNGQNNLLSKCDWDNCLKKGCTLALLQSSQISFTDGFHWNDYERGANELRDFWYEKERELNLSKAVVGGFSAGARVVLYSALTKRIDPQAFVLVGPWIPEISQWKRLIEEVDQCVKGFIICGDQDEDCYQLAKDSCSLLNSGGVSTELQIITGLDHDFPANFDQILGEIIDSMEF